MLVYPAMPVLLALHLLTTFTPGSYAYITLSDEFHSICLNHETITYLDQSEQKHACKVNGTIANCSSRNFTNVPKYLSSDISTLLLTDNKIKLVKGEELAQYYNLQCLDMSFNKLSMLSNNSFWNLSQLEILDLSNNDLALYTTEFLDNRLSVESGFLVPLSNLQLFDFSMNEQQCLQDLIPLLSSITQSNVKRLRLQNIVNPYMPCVTVTKNFTEVLPRDLQELVFTSNSLTIIRHKAIASLPKNLTLLDISDNRLAFGTYLKNFPNLENLQVLKLNGGEVGFDLPTDYPSHEGKCNNAESRSSRSTSNNSSTNGVVLQLPRNLKSVEIKTAGWFYTLTPFKIDPNNSLSSLTLNENSIPELRGPLTGLNRLKQLELVDCNVHHIHETFFCDFPSLESLDLSINTFGHLLKRNSKSSSIFKCLANLKQLNLSFDRITTVSNVALLGLDSLEELYMQNNPMYYFTANILHMRSLFFIDFSYTELARLDHHVTDTLNNIIRHRKKTLTIDFGEAPIHCDCNNLDFLSWLITAKLNLTNKKNKCVFLDTSEQRVTDTFRAIYQSLQRECTPRLSLFVGVFGVTFFVIIAITASIIYRFRWKLRYLYYSAYLSLKSKENQTDKQNMFEYDVFISYVSEDQTFVMKTLYPKLQAEGLNVHVHCLHFIAGQYIASNIVNAIQSSRYTLVVLTRELLDSVWCKFELQMANMERVHTGRPVLVFLLMENLSERELGTELLYHIQNSTYIRYPEATEQLSEHQMDIFWTKLASDLRS